MKSENGEYLGVRHPKKRSARFFKFDGNDFRWTFLWLAILIIASSRTEGLASRFVGIAIVVIWVITMQTLANDLRVHYFPIFKLNNLWIRIIHKGVLWQTKPSDAKAKRSPRGAVFPFEVHAFGDIGLTYTRKKKADTLIFTATGSPISSLSLHAQFNEHSKIADVIRRAAAIAGMKVEVSMGIRARPDDPWIFWDTVAEMGEVEVVLPEAKGKQPEDYTDYDKRMLALENFQAHLPEIGETTNDVDMVFLVTVKRPEAFNKAVRKRTINEKEANEQPIMRIKNVTIPYLEKIVNGPVAILDAEGTERFLRKSWDVFGLGLYYDRAHDRVINNYELTPDQWYPERIVRVTDRYVQIDDTYGATLKMNTFPTDSPFPYEARAFYASHSRWFSNGVIGETVNGGWEYRLLNTSQGFLADAISVLGIQWTGPKVERKEQEVTERLREIDQSTFTQSYNILAAISASSEEELEDNVQKEIDRLTAEGMAPMRVIGESLQFSSYLTATTFIDVC